MKRSKSTREVQPLAAVKAGAALALALAAVCVASLAGVVDRPTRVWRGYETLLVRENDLRPGALEEVVRAMGPGVVSARTASVTFWNFTGISQIPVGEIEARIDPRDPRHDRVMNELPGYFRASGESVSLNQNSGHHGEWSVAYVPARRTAAVDCLRIAALLGVPWHGAWRLAEFDPIEFLVSVAVLLTLALLLAYPFQGPGRARLVTAAAGALLWVPFLIPGGVARLSLAFLLVVVWFPVVEAFVALHGWDEKLLREARDPLVRFLATAGAGLVVLLPASGFSAAALFSCAGSAAASLLVIVALALLWGRARRPRPRRKKFEPVQIVRPAHGAPRPGPVLALLAFAAILVVAVIDIHRSLPVPTPLPVPGAGDFSWESLTRLARESRAARLPDISDLVAHEAFQETLSFGRAWGLPRPDERVYVSEFSTDPRAGTISRGMRRVKVFDTAWLGSVLRQEQPGSIERLLLCQGGARIVVFRGQVRALLRELPVAFLALLVFGTWFARDLRETPLMKSVFLRFNGNARRNQVP